MPLSRNVYAVGLVVRHQERKFVLGCIVHYVFVVAEYVVGNAWRDSGEVWLRRKRYKPDPMLLRRRWAHELTFF